MMNWVQLDAEIGVILALFGVIVGISRAVFKWIRGFDKRWETFMRDWSGEPAAPGRDATPGVMERLNKIDGELKHNGGSTMKDAIRRIETKLQKIDERLEEGNLRFESIDNELQQLKREEK
jgi:hypothetical protein